MRIVDNPTETRRIASPPAVGSQAPDFTLFDSDKNPVRLTDQRGAPVVLLFFPLAFSGGCTKELCAVRDDLAAYRDLNARVLGISVDTPLTLARFKQDQGLNFPLLSDFNKEVSAAYGAQYEEFILGLKGVAKRSAFVVDAGGVVRYVEVLEEPGDMPDFEAVKSTLEELG